VKMTENSINYLGATKACRPIRATQCAQRFSEIAIVQQNEKGQGKNKIGNGCCAFDLYVLEGMHHFLKHGGFEC
jgi:hypothetical protein